MLNTYTRKYVDDKIGLIPMVLDTMRMIEPFMQDPEINYEQAAANNFIALPKREGFWKRFKGTRGGNVDITAYQ